MKPKHSLRGVDIGPNLIERRSALPPTPQSLELALHSLIPLGASPTMTKVVDAASLLCPEDDTLFALAPVDARRVPVVAATRVDDVALMDAMLMSPFVLGDYRTDVPGLFESGHDDDGHAIEPVREQDRLLPMSNLARVAARANPKGKISKAAKHFLQEATSEFIGFLTSEANEMCTLAGRRVLGAGDIITAATKLGMLHPHPQDPAPPAPTATNPPTRRPGGARADPDRRAPCVSAEEALPHTEKEKPRDVIGRGAITSP